MKKKKPKPLCVKWGQFFAGDPVIWRGKFARVDMALKEWVPNGNVPIYIDDEEEGGFWQKGITFCVPADDLDRRQ